MIGLFRKGTDIVGAYRLGLPRSFRVTSQAWVSSVTPIGRVGSKLNSIEVGLFRSNAKTKRSLHTFKPFLTTHALTNLSSTTSLIYHPTIADVITKRQFSTTFVVGNLGLCLFERYVLTRISWYAKIRRNLAIALLIIVGATAVVLTTVGDHMKIVERRRQAQLIGPETEAIIADKAFQFLYGDSFEFLPPDDPIVKRVERIGMRIVSCSQIQELKDLTWTFCVADSDAELAMGRPGGSVMLTRGMIDSLENDHELANVIGHEIGHILCHHVAASLSQMGMFIVGNLALDMLFKSAFLIVPMFEFCWNIPFWKKAEIESDFVGLVLMSRALFDYRMAPHYFQRSHQQEIETGQTPSELSLAFSSWPSSEQRLNVLQKWQEIARRHYIDSKRVLVNDK